MRTQRGRMWVTTDSTIGNYIVVRCLGNDRVHGCFDRDLLPQAVQHRLPPIHSICVTRDGPVPADIIDPQPAAIQLTIEHLKRLS